MAESRSCSSVLWKVEFESNETGYLAKETSKQSVEGVTWFFVTADRKLWEERNKLNTELLNKKESKLKDLENIQPIHTAKKKKKKVREREKSTFKKANRPLLLEPKVAY